MQAPIESQCVPRTSLLAAALRKGLLLGAAALLITPAFAASEDAADATEAPAASATVAEAPAASRKTTAKSVKSAKTGKAGKDSKGAKTAKPAGDAQVAAKAAGKKGTKKAEDLKPGPLADFGKAEAPADVVHVANWVSYTNNAKKKAFVIIDKKAARMFVFDPKGKLKSDTPILLGKAVGDHSVPGIGTKPMKLIAENEKTTPAGRFRALPGRNTHGEDIIWIDYNAAVSMHRMRKVADEERRAERMASPEVSDNRISYGCVNVPHPFYNGVLKPAVMKQGAFVYVLPETTTPQKLFGSFDVPAASVASAR